MSDTIIFFVSVPSSIFLQKVCRPRFKGLIWPNTKHEIQALIGGCFVSTNGFTDTHQFNPCSSESKVIGLDVFHSFMV